MTDQAFRAGAAGSDCGCGDSCCGTETSVVEVRAETGCCQSSCCGGATATAELQETISALTPKSGALPIAIIGAGPVGLAAAAHVLARGETPLVLEAGATVGASIRKWGHVRLFSPWRYAVDPASERLLAEAGWVVARSRWSTRPATS